MDQSFAEEGAVCHRHPASRPSFLSFLSVIASRSCEAISPYAIRGRLLRPTGLAMTGWGHGELRRSLRAAPLFCHCEPLVRSNLHLCHRGRLLRPRAGLAMTSNRAPFGLSGCAFLVPVIASRSCEAILPFHTAGDCFARAARNDRLAALRAVSPHRLQEKERGDEVLPPKR